MTAGVERVLRSVARAHAATGVPITVHTHAAGQHGPRIVEVLTSEGVDLGRVVLGHSGDAVDHPTTWRGWPRPASPWAWTASASTISPPSGSAATWWRSSPAADANRMVLSHDGSCYLDWFDQGALANLKDWHYLHVSQDVIPYLSDHGVSDDQLDAMLTRTPARILAAR